MVTSLGAKINKALNDFHRKVATLNDRESLTHSEVSVALMDLRRKIRRI